MFFFFHVCCLLRILRKIVYQSLYILMHDSLQTIHVIHDTRFMKFMVDSRRSEDTSYQQGFTFIFYAGHLALRIKGLLPGRRACIIPSFPSTIIFELLYQSGWKKAKRKSNFHSNMCAEWLSSSAWLHNQIHSEQKFFLLLCA